MLAGLALLGCAGAEADASGDEALVNEPADIRSLHLHAVEYDRCPPESPCDERYQLQPDGELLHVRRGRSFEGRVPADDSGPSPPACRKRGSD